MKKTLLLMIIVISILLCGCSSGSSEKTSYSLDDIYSEEAYGFYVKDGDNFLPVKYINEDDNEGFQWYVGTLKCPVVTKNKPLVAIFDTNSEMPDEYYIERFVSLGYTVGANIGIGEDGNSLWMSTNNLAVNSNASSKIGNLDLDEYVDIDSINEELPFSNIDTDINILTGLQKNKYYTFVFYSGTKNMKGDLCADTVVLKSRGKTQLANNPLKKTYNQYFIVNLPTNLKNGYYDINGNGLFKYQD